MSLVALPNAFSTDLPSTAVRVSESAARITLIVLGIIYGFYALVSCLFAPWLVTCFDSVPTGDTRPMRRAFPYAFTFVFAYLALVIIVLASLIAAVAVFKSGGGNAAAIAIAVAVPLLAAILAAFAILAVRRRYGSTVVPADDKDASSGQPTSVPRAGHAGEPTSMSSDAV